MFNFNKHAGQQAPLNEKLQKIKAQLAAINAGAGNTKVGGEGATQMATIADDAPLPADKQAAIAREENLVRGALKAVGADYDALIAMEGTEGQRSAYAAAVAANPQVLQEVMAAEYPVLKALEIATSFKPYAEFEAKYGTDPSAIKAAILAEAKRTDIPEEAASPKGLPFSRGGRGAAAIGAAKASKGGLHEVFKK